MKNLIILCLLIFSSCHAQKKLPENQWSKPITIRDYSPEPASISIVNGMPVKDSIIFRASIRPAKVSEKIYRSSYDRIMDVYMSATEQAHYDAIYFPEQAPAINPRYQEGRFDDDHLRLLIIVSIDYKGKEYIILKVKESIHLNKTKDQSRTFVFLKDKHRDYYLLTEYPDQIKLVENLILDFTVETTFLLFRLLSPPEEAAAAIKELRELTLDHKRKSLDVELVLLQIEQWKANKETEKLNTLYEK